MSKADTETIKTFVAAACGVVTTFADLMDKQQVYDSDGNKIKMDVFFAFHRAIDALDKDLVPEGWFD